MVNVYKNDLTLLSGSPCLSVCMLRDKKAVVYRVFAKCCNTPLFIVPAVDKAPFVIAYRQLLDDQDIFPKSTRAIQFSSAAPSAVRRPDVTTNDGWAVPFVLQVLGRLFVGLALGKGTNNPFARWPALCQDTTIITREELERTRRS